MNIINIPLEGLFTIRSDEELQEVINNDTFKKCMSTNSFIQFVIDEDNKLEGVVSTGDLIRAARDAKSLDEVLNRQPILLLENEKNLEIAKGVFQSFPGIHMIPVVNTNYQLVSALQKEEISYTYHADAAKFINTNLTRITINQIESTLDTLGGGPMIERRLEL